MARHGAYQERASRPSATVSAKRLGSMGVESPRGRGRRRRRVPQLARFGGLGLGDGVNYSVVLHT